MGGGLCLPVIDTHVGFWDEPNMHIAWAQYLMAPCSPGGWCMLGEMDKYNPASRMRLENVSFHKDGVDVGVLGVKGEQVLMYAITPQNTIIAHKVVVGANGTTREPPCGSSLPGILSGRPSAIWIYST
jgi:hypothetical protein